MIVSILQKLLPTTLKVYIGELASKNSSVRSLFAAKLYLNDVHENKEFVVGLKGKVLGKLTADTSKLADITFSKPKFRYIKDNIFDRVTLKNILERLTTQDTELLIQEASRILKPEGMLVVEILDFSTLISLYQRKGEDSSTLYDTETRKEVGAVRAYSDIDTINSLISRKKIETFVTKEKVISLLATFGFEITATKQLGDITVVVAHKAIHTELYSKVARELPTMQDIESDVDWPAYLGFCDPAWVLDKYKSFSEDTLHKIGQRTFYSVIGSMFFINLLPLLKPKKLVLFDICKTQVDQMLLYRDIISIARDYEDFLSLVFSRPFQKDLSVFLSSEPDSELIARSKAVATNMHVYEMTIGKIAQARAEKIEDDIQVLRIENNSMCQAITVLEEDRFKPGPGMNVLYYNEHLVKHFSEIQQLIVSADILMSGIDDEVIMKPLQKTNGIIFVSNIGEENWIHGTETSEEFSVVMRRGSHLSDAFKKQWSDSYVGFKSFLSKTHAQFWIVDSQGNIFNSSEFLTSRTDSHEWLWQKLQPQLSGTTIEIIHSEENTWGFKEHLNTIKYSDYLEADEIQYETVVLHMLYANGIDLSEMKAIVEKAAVSAKRIIVLEHAFMSSNIPRNKKISLDRLITLINQGTGQQGDLTVMFAGTGKTDTIISGAQPELIRNVLVTCDL